MCGQLLSVLLLAAATHAQLDIATTPVGMEIWIDGSPFGPSPVTVHGLVPGLHSIRALSRHMWTVQPVDTIVSLQQGVNRLALTAQGALQIICEGVAATVAEDNRIIGHTPLLITRDHARKRRFRAQVDGTVLHQWEWTPIPGAFTTVSIAPPKATQATSQRRTRRGAAITAAAAAAMALTSAVLARHADGAFDDYSHTADPDRAATLFRRAQRLDRWASGLWNGFEIGASAALVWWIVSP